MSGMGSVLLMAVVVSAFCVLPTVWVALFASDAARRRDARKVLNQLLQRRR